MGAKITDRIGVFVDGDNVSASHAEAILKLSQRHGSATVVRVYLNAGCNSGWHNAHSYRIMHAGIGKNAADLLLAIDVMEFVLSNALDKVILASSDGDFSHLAHRLRERSLPVIGVGDEKAPKVFKAACSDFTVLESVERCSCPTIAKAKNPNLPQIDRNIHSVISAHSRKGAGIKITQLNVEMRAKFGTCIGTHEKKTWRGYLASRPDLYDLDPKSPDAMVRFKPDGFAG